MKRKTFYGTAIATLYLLVAAITFSCPAKADTHLGQPLSSLITLSTKAIGGIMTGGLYESSWHLVNPSGSNQKFVLPPSQSLVITDLDWQYIITEFHGNANTLQQEYQLMLSARDTLIYQSNPHAFVETAIFSTQNIVDPLHPNNVLSWKGRVTGGHDNLTAGLVINNQEELDRLRAYLYPFFYHEVTSSNEGKVILHGYTITNRLP